MVEKAITRLPPKSYKNAVRKNQEKVPDYESSLKQHEKYREALSGHDVDVITLDREDDLPDSVFVEDPAVVMGDTAVICRPGVESRRGEEKAIKKEISKHVENIEEIKAPATIEGGDVLEAEDHFFVGLTDRTNKEGAEEFIRIAENNGFRAETFPVEKFLHLKSGISYIGDDHLLGVKEYSQRSEFDEYEFIEVVEGEEYCANSIHINGTVFFPEGYEKTLNKLRERGFDVKTLDMSEFRKADGGLSCLSIRF